uniref:Uncharacterized protein n=1 Tax=Rhodnius prolixus TaxID=13249 RepID=T1HHE1_RHOPR
MVSKYVVLIFIQLLDIFAEEKCISNCKELILKEETNCIVLLRAVQSIIELATRPCWSKFNKLYKFNKIKDVVAFFDDRNIAGINIKGSRDLSFLLYADDMTILCHSWHDTQRKLNILAEYCIPTKYSPLGSRPEIEVAIGWDNESLSTFHENFCPGNLEPLSPGNNLVENTYLSDVVDEQLQAELAKCL